MNKLQQKSNASSKEEEFLYSTNIDGFGSLDFPRVFTIYMGKPDKMDGKSNDLQHSVWEFSKNMDCDLRQCHF